MKGVYDFCTGRAFTRSILAEIVGEPTDTRSLLRRYTARSAKFSLPIRKKDSDVWHRTLNEREDSKRFAQRHEVRLSSGKDDLQGFGQALPMVPLD